MVEPKPDSAGYFCCTFCGKHQRKVRKLIRGFQAVICNECVALCNDIIAEGGPSYNLGSTSPTPSNYATANCSFCSKPVERVSKLIAGPPDQYICEKCVGLCNDIIAEEVGRSR